MHHCCFVPQALVGRYLSQIAERGPAELQLLKIQIEVGCYGISRRFFRKTKWLIICMMALFFALFGFEMTGDQQDVTMPHVWVWSVVLYFLFPLPIFICFQLYLNKKKIKDSFRKWLDPDYQGT